MLSCRGLKKSYVTERGEVAAVAGIDLDVATGRFAALLLRFTLALAFFPVAMSVTPFGSVGAGASLRDRLLLRAELSTGLWRASCRA